MPHAIKTILSFSIIILTLIACEKDNFSSQVKSDCIENMVNGETPPDSNIILGIFEPPSDWDNDDTLGYIFEIYEPPFDWDNDDTLVNALTKFLNPFGTSSAQADNVYSNGFKGFSTKKLNRTQLEFIKRLPWVKNVYPNTRVSIVGNCESKSFKIEEGQIKPEGVKIVGSRDATGKRVFVFDTGVDPNHEDLNVNTSLSRNFVDPTRTIDIGIFNDNNFSDGHGHGTHVSGTIAALDNDKGVIGVAANAEIVALKVLDDLGQGSSANIIQAIDYVLLIAQPGDVANFSLGGVRNELLNRSIELLAAKGVYCSVAAGNETQNADNVSPASASGDNIFTVSAVDNQFRYAPFSNFGNPPIDFAQPGVNVLSTAPNNEYKYLSGTSMAAPHMAGILLNQGTNFRIITTAKNDPDGEADAIAAN